MKKCFALCFLFCFLATESADAQLNSGYYNQVSPIPTVQKNRVMPTARTSVEGIKLRQKVRCGSNLSVKSYAHQDDDGIWRGIDADLCRVIAEAILGDESKIEIVNILPSEVSRALNNNRIDVMLSGAFSAAKLEIEHQALSVGMLYYDEQRILVRGDEIENLADLKNKKICITNDSDEYKNFDDYNVLNGLKIHYLTFADRAKAKEAFLLKRCQAMTAGYLYLNGLKQEMPNLKAQILSDSIAVMPVYAFVQNDNSEFRMVLKWILNALLLAEKYNINAQNMEFFASNDNPELRNLLGDDPHFWQSLGLRPDWVKKAVQSLGNYADIYERNLGLDSPINLDRGQAKLIKNGGSVWPLPFM